jgi:hypothetical protein
MSINLDRDLRATLGRLAETPPPGDLAERTVRGALRRHRRAATARTVVALTAVVLALPVGLAAVAARTGGDGQPSGPVGRMAVTSISRLATDADGRPLPPLTDAGNDYHSLVLEPRTGTYRELEYDAAALSPDGRTALVADGNNGARPFRAGLLDLETDTVRWIDLTIDGARLDPFSARWSPDGDRVLLEREAPMGPDQTTGFAIVDASTLASTYVPINEPASTDVVREGLAWMPDGDGLVGTLMASVVAETDTSAAVGLRVYGLDGEVVRDISVAGSMHGERAFAPDGRRVALATGENYPWTNLLRIVDVSSGAVVAEVPLTEQSVLVGWYDDGHLVMRPVNSDRTGAAPPRPLQVVDLGGRVVKTVQLPGRARDTIAMEIGSADVLHTVGSALVF